MSGRFVSNLTGWLAVLAFVAPAALGAGIRVENVADGDTLRYPLALLRGTLDGDQPIRVTNTDHPGRGGTTEAPAALGRFAVLVELRPGPNRLSLSSGDHSASLTLTYRPMTTDYRVRVIYVTDRDGHTAYLTQKPDDPQNYRDRLDTAARLLQTFTAEVMNAQGHGRKTFALELDDEGRVVVHTERYPASGEELRARSGNELYGMLYPWIDERFPMRRSKNMVLMGFSGYDPKTMQAQAHTALGGGGQGVFSNLFLFCWPESPGDVVRAFSDTTAVDRSKVYHDVGLPTLNTLASTTLGAVLHEMGHTFGLPHTSDPRCIMSRGFDNLRLNFLPADVTPAGPVPIRPEQTATFSPYMAAHLARSRWFQPDGPPGREGRGPRLRIDRTEDRLVVEAPDGLDALLAHVGGGEVRRGLVQPFESGPESTAIPLAKLRAELGDDGPIQFTAYDRQLNAASLDEAADRDPAWFLNAWQLLEQPVPLADLATAPPAPAALEAIRDTLRKRPRRPIERNDEGPFYSADLLQVYGNLDNMATYARREVSVDRDREARLLAGGDDGFRIWLNGELVLDRPGARVVLPDGESASVRFRRGRNEILVESQQAGGGWGFSIRLVDPDGRPIPLDRP